MQTTTVGRELRFLADHYEQNQRMRIAVENCLRAVLQGRDETWGVDIEEHDEDVTPLLHAIRSGEEPGPVPILSRSYQRYWLEERETYRDMMAAWKIHPVYSWINRVKGIGPTLGCKILARLDPEKAPHASSFWSYCGLATIPGLRWECEDCGRVRGYPESYNVTGKHQTPDGKRCDGLLKEQRGEYRVAMPAGFTIDGPDGKRRPYDAYAKKIMYLVGTSFLKAGGPYEEIYRRARAKYELERPGWDKGRRHQAALRIAEKLFLSHLWEVWRTAIGMTVGEPYAVAELGHEKIDPWDMVD